MSPNAITLHHALIRHAKGIISAWEKWLSDETAEAVSENLKVRRYDQAQDIDTVTPKS